MNKQLCGITFILLLFAMLASAEPLSIVLNSPIDKASSTEYTQAFIFSFNQAPDVFNCSLIINNEVKGFRNSLLTMNNNKISESLNAGTYSWSVSCVDKSFAVISSAIRTFTIEASAGSGGGYQTIFNNNGLRSYVISIVPGEIPVTLPAIKGGEDIQVKFGGKTYYIDVLTMGVDVDKDFVEIRDRTSGKHYDMLVPSTLEFDFNNDKTIDIALLLNNVERGVNAYFTVTPYPSGTVPVAPVTPPETPSSQPVQPETPPVETPPTGSGSEEIPAETTQPPPQTGTESPSEPEKGETSTTWIIPAIVAVLIVIILIIAISSLKGKKPVKKNPEKGAKKEAKKEMPEPEQQFSPDEKFDIIKSTGRKNL